MNKSILVLVSLSLIAVSCKDDVIGPDAANTGPNATTEQKIIDGHTWTLVEKADSGKKTWLDETSGLLWGDQMDQKQTWASATTLCTNPGNFDGPTTYQGAPITWRLPTYLEYQEAENNGSCDVLTTIVSNTLWAAEQFKGYTVSAHSGCTSSLFLGNASNALSVRCVGTY